MVLCPRGGGSFDAPGPLIGVPVWDGRRDTRAGSIPDVDGGYERWRATHVRIVFLLAIMRRLSVVMFPNKAVVSMPREIERPRHLRRKQFFTLG